MGKLIDLTGQTFNYLTVLYRDNTKKSKEAYWVCQCKCGNIKSVRSSCLRQNLIYSCGCYNKENARKLGIKNKHDIVGNKYGKLLVLEDTGLRSNDRQVMWKCKCDCGNIINVKAGNLISGNTFSCGCLVSYGEYYIQQILEKNEIKFQKQFSFFDLKDKGKLRFDFSIFLNNKQILLEYDGEQHYDSTNIYFSKDMQKHDKMKNEYCKNNNIPLIRFNKEDLEEEIILEKINNEL